MVEISKPPYEKDEPIHQGYMSGAEKVYFEREKQKEHEKRMQNFREGLGAIRIKYLEKDKQ